MTHLAATHLHEVLLDHIVTLITDGKHACLRADIPQVCAVEVLAKLQMR